jgi:hypothetical protein
MTIKIEAKTAKGAAKQLHRAVGRMIKNQGLDPEQESSLQGETLRDGRIVWHVCWEGGSPYEWSSKATGGDGIWDEDMGWAPTSPTFSFTHIGWMADCRDSITVSFYPES